MGGPTSRNLPMTLTVPSVLWGIQKQRDKEKTRHEGRSKHLGGMEEDGGPESRVEMIFH